MTGAATAAQTGSPQQQRFNRHGVTASAVVRCPLDQIGTLRQQLGPPGGKPFPAAFLKPSDEQTVVALAAVLQAIDRHGLSATDFSDWGVVAAPRFLGRIASAETLNKFECGGAWKAPPLFVPHRSLHAVSGTISQALQCQGPNFGAGGGPRAALEGLLAALTLLDEQDLPGLWLVLSQCDPEPRPDRAGANPGPVVCAALALAITPVANDWLGLRLSLRESVATGSRPQHATFNAAETCELFASLAAFVGDGTRGSQGTWSFPLTWGHTLVLTDEN